MTLVYLTIWYGLVFGQSGSAPGNGGGFFIVLED